MSSEWPEVAVGAGLGLAGAIAKVPEMALKKIYVNPSTISSRLTICDKDSDFSLDVDYSSLGVQGNSKTWGGVLALRDEILKEKDLVHSIENYLNFVHMKGVQGSLVARMMLAEMKSNKLEDNLFRKKLWITPPAIAKNRLKQVCKEKIVKSSIAKIEGLSGRQLSLVDQAGKVVGEADQVLLAAGSLQTHNILKNSGLVEKTSFLAHESLFGRVGRVELSKECSFGFFHKIKLGKSIRMKSGIEVRHKNGSSALFFFQPGFAALEATDVKLLKEYLTLKTKFSLRECLTFLMNPRLVFQVLMGELDSRLTTKVFDIYAVIDVNNMIVHEESSRFVGEVVSLKQTIKELYQTFIDYLHRSGGVRCIDHDADNPIYKNLESAYHLCGSVNLNLSLKQGKIPRLAKDERIFINDNSVISHKGIANPTIMLF